MRDAPPSPISRGPSSIELSPKLLVPLSTMTDRILPKRIGDKFEGATGTAQDQAFRAQTIGLVTAEEFHKAAQAAAPEPKKVKKKKKRQFTALSFTMDEEDEDTPVLPKKALRKDPTVDTSFLPDREERTERERLEAEWHDQQERAKNEELEITYSYWDGSGHRRQVSIQAKRTIGDFLEQARRQLHPEFPELSSADELLYVKEDLILPHDLTFHDLIVTQARGKSGPLFRFDVHEDLRVGDRRVPTEASHPGKVVERRWYERHKHIFPASRWELYNPKKEYGKKSVT